MGNTSQAMTYGLGNAQGYVEEFESGNQYCVAVVLFTAISLTELEFAMQMQFPPFQKEKCM